MTDPAPAKGLEFGEKVVVLGGGILAALALTAINPVMPIIDKELARSATDHMLVKQLFGFTSLAMMIGAPLGAYLSDRIGMRRMLLAGTLVYTLAGTAGLYLSSLPWLLVSRLLVGASAAAIQVMSLTLINTKLDGNERAKWMGLFVSVATFSTLFIHPLSGVLGEIGWRWPFAEYLAGLALFAALLAGHGGDIAPSAHAAVSEGRREPLFSWFPWHYLPLSLLIGSIVFMPTAYGPFLMREKAGLSPFGIALVLTVSALLGATVSLLYGRIRQTLSTHAVFALSFGLAGAGALTAAIAGSVPLLLAGLLMHGIGVASLVPNIMTALGAKLTAERQARAAGLVKAAHFLSAPLCIYLQETFAGRFGPSMAMLVVALLAFSVFAAALVRIATAQRSKPLPAE